MSRIARPHHRRGIADDGQSRNRAPRCRTPRGARLGQQGQASKISALYAWPLKPFHEAHPVRGYFNDPRISGKSRAFHFGIDIAAPNGTPVYAVRAGVVHLQGGRSLSVADGDLAFGYWHVIPAVTHHQRVAQHQLLGHVESPWLHLHFAEHRAGVYCDPLRPGGLTPVGRRDQAAGDEDRALAQRPAALARRDLWCGGRDRRGSPDAAARRARAVARPARDPGPHPLARPPRRPDGAALAHAGRLQPWDAAAGEVPLDLRARHPAEPPRETRPVPLLPRPHLEHLAAPGRPYHVEVEASDLYGNKGSLQLPFTIANDV